MRPDNHATPKTKQSVSTHRQAMVEVDNLVCSNFPLITICTHEEGRVMQALRSLTERDDTGGADADWSLLSWDLATGVTAVTDYSNVPEKRVDQMGVLDWFAKQEPLGPDRFLLIVLKDFQKLMGRRGHESVDEARLVRNLRNLVDSCRSKQKAVIILGSSLYLPADLEKSSAVIDWPLPEREHIADKVTSMLEIAVEMPQVQEQFRTEYTPDEMDEIVSAFQGLTLTEIEQLVTFQIITEPALDPRAIARKKREVIRKAGLLDWIEVEHDMGDVGGLAEFKHWLDQRADAFSQEARDFGLPLPKGVLLIGMQGGGKCFQRDTPILMFDGSIRAVQDVRVGDQVMGPDSCPRNVLGTTVGQGELYEVRPNKGNAYTVNADHILALRQSGFHNPKNKTSFKNVDDNGDCLISVRDYLGTTKTFKSQMMGYRSGVEFPEQFVPLDPYFLGLWLGDGSAKASAITTMDSETVDFLTVFAEEKGLKISKKTKKNNPSRAATYFLTTGHASSDGRRKDGCNLVRTALIGLGVWGNKHIPQIYQVNTRANRLELLAGLIDTDGYQKSGTVAIIQKSRAMADGIAFIARSLGLGTTFSALRKHCWYKGEKREGTYFHVSITGDTDMIPCRLLRKQAGPRKHNKNVLNTGITVTPTGTGDYYGFEVDGDHKFLLGDFTVTHNSLSAKAVAFHWKLPLLKLDMGRMFGSLVGSSEENVRSATRIAESVAPCVLWCDELDKGMSGTASSNNTDGGTAARVFGTMLTWMQDKTAPVFVVATANDVSQLPPELLRKGRFDEIWFVDLPSAADRKDIFRIHIKKRGRRPEDFDLSALAEKSVAFTGAEIEAAVVSALYDAFYDGRRELRTGDVLKAVRQTVPLAVTMKEKITRLRVWAQTRARDASLPQTLPAADALASEKQTIMAAMPPLSSADEIGDDEDL